MKSKNVLFGVFTALFLLVSAVSAVPHLINYEGQLYSSSGSPLTGDYTIVFKIYDVSAGGTALWTETYDSTNKVHVQNGLFNVLLGSRTELNLNFDVPYYLEISVNSEKLSPRQPLASVGYAYRTENATNAETLDNLDSLQLQRRVSGVCASGSAINTINENGTLVCAQITGGSGSDSDWIISGNNMYANVSGNIGIGTVNPLVKLDVLGDAQFGPYANSGEDVYGGWVPVILSDTDTCNGDITNGYACPVDMQKNCVDIKTSSLKRTVACIINRGLLLVDANGNVGIGTISPSEKLEVNGNIQVSNGNIYVKNGKLLRFWDSGGTLYGNIYAWGNQLRLQADSGGDVGIVSDAGSGLIVKDSGNVGIGTATPTAKLEVNGDVKFGCPSGMVKVGSFCMDQYEASVWSNAGCTGTQYGASSDDYLWNDNGNDFAGYACSKSGVLPSAYITWFQAQQACGNAGKRLCTNAEWQMAAAGTPDDCASCPCNELSLQNTGSHSSCKSRWNVYDMNGNLWEWVADWTQGAGETDISGSLYEDAGPNYGDDYQYAVRDANWQGNGQNFPAAFVRGGYWLHGGSSGVFALYLGDAPSDSLNRIGFRCCQ